MIKVYFQTEETDELLEILYNFNKLIGVLAGSGNKTPLFF